MACIGTYLGHKLYYVSMEAATLTPRNVVHWHLLHLCGTTYMLCFLVPTEIMYEVYVIVYSITGIQKGRN